MFTFGVPAPVKYALAVQYALCKFRDSKYPVNTWTKVCVVSLIYLQVTRLCDLSVEGDSVTSVGWSERVS